MRGIEITTRVNELFQADVMAASADLLLGIITCLSFYHERLREGPDMSLYHTTSWEVFHLHGS